MIKLGPKCIYKKFIEIFWGLNPSLKNNIFGGPKALAWAGPGWAVALKS
jgi:hypothetical protein